VVNAAYSNHRTALAALIEGLAGSGKPLLHTSGSSIVADNARGDCASDRILNEDTPPEPDKAARVAVAGARGGAQRTDVFATQMGRLNVAAFFAYRAYKVPSIAIHLLAHRDHRQ
jgi:hypothetical protein